ncbi:MAG: EAL domain-containing protein [Serpentinimonas sp.]|nr:EAL domain-containing protein [Serpentinimonas sp.]
MSSAPLSWRGAARPWFLRRSLLVAAVLASVLVGAVLTVQHLYQERRLLEASALARDLGRASEELHWGFTHLALGSESESPWQRAQGLVLLEQAVQSYQRIATDPSDSGLITPQLRQQLQSFTEQLSAARTAYGSDPLAEVDEFTLHLAMFALLDAAAAVDARARMAVDDLARRLHRVFAVSLALATVLLVGVCTLLLVGQRAREKAERRLQRSEERWRFALEGAGDAVWDWDLASGRFEYSPRWAEMRGYAATELGQSRVDWEAAIHPEDRPAAAAALQAALKEEARSYLSEHRVRCKDGHWLWVLERGMLARQGPRGEPLRMLGTTTDISAQKAAQEQIWRQANFDVLTGLPNRRMMRDRLLQEVEKSVRRNEQMALLFIDLDHFKEVNDTLGHQVGDQLLIEAGRRIESCVRSSDTVARQGGDEFTVVLPTHDNPARAQEVAERIIAVLRQPFDLGKDRAFITGSVGITMCPDDSTDADVLLANADRALYAAKAAGRNRFSYFTAGMQEAAMQRLQVANDLRDALDTQQFFMVYQPIVDLNTGAIHKAEALVRWRHPARGIVGPGQFIPVAESTGLIMELGDWILKAATSTLQDWKRQHDATFQMSVNQSPVQFRRTEGRQLQLLDVLRERLLSGSDLVLEITEGILLDPEPSVLRLLVKYQQAGVALALDDFGTGYSSMSYLQRFDIDFIKIDRAFVHNLQPGSRNHMLCKAMITMAHELGLRVIAEGIETELEMTLLRDAGCDFGQGYFWGQPLPAPEFVQAYFSGVALPPNTR